MGLTPQRTRRSAQHTNTQHNIITRRRKRQSQRARSSKLASSTPAAGVIWGLERVSVCIYLGWRTISARFPREGGGEGRAKRRKEEKKRFQHEAEEEEEAPLLS